MLDERQLTAARHVLSERTVNGKPLSFADSARMVEEEFDQSGLGDLVREIPNVKPPSVYFGDLHEADNWVWKYQKDIDEWWFFADDYVPIVSVKVTRRFGSPLPIVRRSTTMPKGMREVIMRSGLTLFGKSTIGVFRVAMNMTVIMKAADDLLATTEWMKTR